MLSKAIWRERAIFSYVLMPLFAAISLHHHVFAWLALAGVVVGNVLSLPGRRWFTLPTWEQRVVSLVALAWWIWWVVAWAMRWPAAMLPFQAGTLAVLIVLSGIVDYRSAK